MLGEGAHGLGHDGVAVGGVSALIGEALYLAGGEGAVLVQPCYDMEAYGMAYPVGYEGLLAGAVYADAAPAYLSAAPCAQGLVGGDAYTVFTNRPAAGAMRGYGMPQASFADDSNIDECARALGMDPMG